MNTLSRSASRIVGAEVSALFLRDGNHLVARGVSDIEGKLVDFVREPLRTGATRYVSSSIWTGCLPYKIDQFPLNVRDTSGHQMIAITKEEGAHLGPTQFGRGARKRVHHCVKIERRAADHLEHVGGSGLLL